MNKTINLNYDDLTWLHHQGDREGLIAALQEAVDRYDFVETDETRWAFLRVRSYLEDGWRSLQSYIKFRSDQDIDCEDVGHLINFLVRGSSPDVTNGEGCRRYVFNKRSGPPAALLFFCTTLSPEEALVDAVLDEAS